MNFKTISAGILCTFLSLQAFSQTYMLLAKPAGSKEWGFVNLKGEYVVKPQYRKVGEFSPDGFAPVYEDRMYHFINTKGEKLETEVKDYRLKNFFGFGIRGFEGGLAPVEVDKKWGYIDKSGKLVIPAKYDEVTEFRDGYASAALGEYWYVIDQSGNETSVKVVGLKGVRNFSEGLAIMDDIDGQFGYINTKGEVVISPKFASVGDFNNGLAWAKNEEGMYGYINNTGEWVISPTYDATRDFDGKSGMARVKKGDEWFYIDKAGKPLKIELSRYDDFRDGLAKAKKEDKVGFIDKGGNWVIKPTLEDARDFQNGYAAARVGEKWGLINTKGEWVIQPQFEGLYNVVAVQ